MRISYSRYTAFLQSPERFRLHYMLGLTPEGDDTPNRMNMGRRRGRCFHELLEATAKGTIDKERSRLVHECGLDLVERCEDMLAVFPDVGPLSHVEESFEVPILDGKHSIVGRIDHTFGIVGDDVNPFTIGDPKTTKGSRTKKELVQYLGELETSSQSAFYLKAARELGFGTDYFRYHVILDRKDAKSKPQYIPLDLHIGRSDVERAMEGVYAAAEMIGFLKDTYGIERPWPHPNAWPCCGDKFFCGYQGLCGRTIPKGAEPDGFTYRWKEQIQSEDGAQ